MNQLRLALRLDPRDTPVTRPKGPGAELPGWAKKAIGTSWHVGMTRTGRLAALGRSSGVLRAGWIAKGGDFVPFAFDGRSVPAAVHPSAERMLVEVGEYLRGALWEVDLDTSEATLVTDHPGTTGAYVGDDLVVTSAGGAGRARTGLWRRSREGYQRLDEHEGGAASLAGPFELEVGDGAQTVTVVLSEDRHSITHAADVWLVDGDRLVALGTLAAAAPAGFGGYGKDPFVVGGRLLVKSQKKRSNGASWYALSLVAAESEQARFVEASSLGDPGRIAEAWSRRVSEPLDGSALEALLGRQASTQVRELGLPSPDSGSIFLPAFDLLVAADNSFEAVLAESRRNPTPLMQVFTSCYHLHDDEAGGDSFMVWLRPAGEAPVVRWSHEAGRPTQIAAADLATWWWITERLGKRRLKERFGVADGRFGRGAWEPMGAVAENVFDQHVGSFDRERRELEQCAARVHWIAHALAHGAVGPGALDVHPSGLRLEHELRLPRFEHDPPGALYWLWRSFLLGEERSLASLLDRLPGSNSRLVRDAAALVKSSSPERFVDRAELERLRRQLTD